MPMAFRFAAPNRTPIVPMELFFNPSLWMENPAALMVNPLPIFPSPARRPISPQHRRPLRPSLLPAPPSLRSPLRPRHFQRHQGQLPQSLGSSMPAAIRSTIAIPAKPAKTQLASINAFPKALPQALFPIRIAIAATFSALAPTLHFGPLRPL